MKKISDIIFNLFYDCLLLILLLAWVPKFCYDYFKQCKYRSNLAQRLGINYPSINKEGRSLIWIHAVSVGETKAISKLVKELQQRADKPVIVISSITETGHEEAVKSMPGVDYHVYLPFDFSFIIKPIIKSAKPDMVIFVETDFWYNFIRIAKDCGAKVGLVNGKISERSLSRFHGFSFFAKRVFEKFDFMCVQNNHYRENFLSLTNKSSNITTTGNIKLSDCCPYCSADNMARLRASFGISNKAKVLVAGSTHAGEEELVINSFKALKGRIPDLYLILVPRHPERFSAVAKLLESNSLKYRRYSSLDVKSPAGDVLLVDAMGQLRKCYQLADVAIVAGSFIETVGGHNILEPSCYGVPVIFGPYMKSQPDFLHLALEYGAGVQVSAEALTDNVENLFNDGDLRNEIGQSGIRLWSQESGAMERTLEKIKFFEKTPCG